MPPKEKDDVAARAKRRFQKLQEEYHDDEDEGDVDGLGGTLRDFSGLKLKPDHDARPLWVCPDGAILLEASSRLYAAAYDFLVAVAEPVARPEFVHQYKLTPHSLYAAVAVGISPASICDVLDKLSKVPLPRSVRKRVRRADISPMHRVAAAAARRTVRGTTSRRGRGREVDSPWYQVAGTPRPRRG